MILPCNLDVKDEMERILGEYNWITPCLFLWIFYGITKTSFKP